jgi:cell division protein FtsI/penicillin-binding protein 2
LQQAFHTYGLLSEKDAVIRLLGEEKSKLSRNLAILFYAWHPGANEEALSQWLQQQMGHVEPEEVSRLVKAYGNPHLNLLDYAFLLKRDPLEIWCAGELLRNRNVSWSNLWFDSTLPRRQASAWLFHPRHRKAQDTRLRIRIEQDAFARMTPYWRRLGFPFERLVPSYATAIGSSGDRPAALAELVGVILNNGIRYPAVRIRQLRFAEGTPYQTVFEPQPRAGQRVMDESVARAMREVLAGVVTNGTAKRVAGAFALPDGTPVPVGGKTGSGDNRSKKFARGGYVVSSRAVNRTATFVFYIGDRYFGVLTVFVPGQQAAEYRFTSALPVTILRLLAPSINSRLAVPHASPVAGKLNASATALSRPSGSAGRM